MSCGEIAGRRMHVQVEWLRRGKSERAGRRGRELGRRHLGAIDHDAAARRVHREIGAIERERTQRAAGNASVASHVDLRKAPVRSPGPRLAR